MNKIETLQKWIDESNNIVFFGGAGVSTESGIKDFRSKDGLYNAEYDYPPEEILSHHFFIKNTQEFYKFYKDKMNALSANPNIIHNYLAYLEKKNKLKYIITQNIDNLHTEAGNKYVLELHGNINRNYCIECGKFFDGEYVFKSENIPKCECGGTIKPDVVLYEEALNDEITNEAIKAIYNADVLIVAGTSLKVYPASGFLTFYKGDKMVIINNDVTDFDQRANLIIHDSLKEVFNKLKRQ